MRKNMFLYLILLFVSPFAFGAKSNILQPKKSKLFRTYGISACLMCDTSNPKTRVSHLQDIYRMKRLLEALAKSQNAPLRLHLIKGKNLNSRNIQKWARKTSRYFKSLLFIYYSGDEGPKQPTPNEWPLLHIVNKKKPNNSKGLSVKGFFQLLQKQSHQQSLTLCFFDCYDKVIPIDKGLHSFASPSYSFPSQKPRLFNYLFTLPQRTLVAVSKSQKSPAYGIKEGSLQGGLFSLLLADQIARAEPPILWKDLLWGVQNQAISFIPYKNRNDVLGQKVLFDTSSLLHPELQKTPL